MIEGSFRGRLHGSVVTLNIHTHTRFMFIISAVLSNVSLDFVIVLNILQSTRLIFTQMLKNVSCVYFPCFYLCSLIQGFSNPSSQSPGGS